MNFDNRFESLILAFRRGRRLNRLIDDYGKSLEICREIMINNQSFVSIEKPVTMLCEHDWQPVYEDDDCVSPVQFYHCSKCPQRKTLDEYRNRNRFGELPQCPGCEKRGSGRYYHTCSASSRIRPIIEPVPTNNAKKKEGN